MASVTAVSRAGAQSSHEKARPAKSLNSEVPACSGGPLVGQHRGAAVEHGARRAERHEPGDGAERLPMCCEQSVLDRHAGDLVGVEIAGGLP
jgi:hypothetical protein